MLLIVKSIGKAYINIIRSEKKMLLIIAFLFMLIRHNYEFLLPGVIPIINIHIFAYFYSLWPFNVHFISHKEEFVKNLVFLLAHYGIVWISCSSMAWALPVWPVALWSLTAEIKKSAFEFIVFSNKLQGMGWFVTILKISP